MTATVTNSDPLLAAQAYRAAGISVVRIKRDGSKKPIGTWKYLEERLPTEAEVKAWWAGNGSAPGIATICGRVSGGLETIDFDHEAETIFPDWTELVDSEVPGLVAQLTITRTPKPGFHVRYRCTEVEIPGNTDLAKREDDEVLIETRGKGGYALAPGCPADCHHTGQLYEHFSGPKLSQVQTITAVEREVLIRCAMSFDRRPKTSTHEPNADRRGWKVRPGDAFNHNGPSWSDLLCPKEWVQVYQRGSVTYWKRPGKDAPGHSATTGYCHGDDGTELFHVFTRTAHPFEAEQSYSKFTVYALLNHGGDFKAAARALHQEGFGERTDDARPTQCEQSAGGSKAGHTGRGS